MSSSPGAPPSPAASPSAPPPPHHFSLASGSGRELLDEHRAAALLPPPGERAYTHVSLSGKSFSLAAARLFAPRLASLPHLTDLDLSDIIAQRNSEEAVGVLDCLCSAVSGHQLQALNLSDNAIGARGVAAVSRALSGQRQLRRVLFNNNGLEGSAVRAIVDALLAPFAGAESEADGRSSAPVTTALEHAEFSRNLLHDDGPKALVPLLLASPQLQHFVVSRVSSDGGPAIAAAVASLSSLVHLNLSDSTLGPTAGLVLAQQLLVPDRTQRLTHLQLGDIGVNDRQESGQAIAAIVAALRHSCPHLQLLDLHQNDIDSRLARRLAQALANKPELTALNLDDNALRSSGAAAIAASLRPRTHPRLSQLSLDNNGLTAAVVPALLPLVLSGGLQRLGLNSNRLSSAAVEQLRDAVAQVAQAADAVLGSLSDNEEPEDDEDEDDDVDADVVGDAEAAEAAGEEREDADQQVDELAAALDSALGSETEA